MNNKFDELTKQMAQSVTRREALKQFDVGRLTEENEGKEEQSQTLLSSRSSVG